MRFLVTGGGGFVGSHLCERLLQSGHSVVALDNFSTGSVDNVRNLRDLDNFEVLDWDVSVPFDVEVDGIFNLACPASPIHYQKSPTRTIKTSVLGAINSLELAKKLGVPVLQASTSEVYGDPRESPQNEAYWGNVNPIGIRACYDEGKRAAETLFVDYHREFSLDIRIARIFNTYGPRMALNDGRVVPQFITQALRGEPITIYGDGQQTRSFCYVDDLVSGLASLFFTPGEHRPINLGNPQPITMVELADEIISLTNSTSNVLFMPLPQDDPLTREPDIRRARDVLDWSPRVGRTEGFTATIADIRPRVEAAI
jgi:UDP-glucuronate decarboxylase